MKEELHPEYIETPAKYIQQPEFRPGLCGLWGKSRGNREKARG